MVVKQPSLVVNGMDKRRSFSDAKVELANFLVTNCAKVVSADMPPFMQIHAVGFARKIKDSLEKFTSKTLALSLKKELDGVYGPAWHCIVGTSFGSFVTHSVGGFLYFSLDQKLYVLIFKTTVQRAD
uniref:Dynein light chain n=2 Tax=Chenopodium quinoa TaxID=63459 RepID=A0A803M1E4_CHEQI